MPALLHDWPLIAAERHPDACLLQYRGVGVSAAELVGLIRAAAAQFRELGLPRGERVAVFLPKLVETVAAGPGRAGRAGIARVAVWSGDAVKRDADGYLYFIGREGETIKTSGYRVSPTEVEEVLAQHPGVAEAGVLGVPHALLGQAIVAVVAARPEQTLEAELPRSPNGKFDRSGLAKRFAGLFTGTELA